MRFSLRTLLVGFAMVAAGLFTFAGVAGAQEGDGAYVGSTTVPTTAPLPVVEAASVVADPGTSANSLAFTGSDVTVLAIMGGLAVAAGAGFLVVRRRTAAA
jgi:LPXTG-motif cell wall-anchored protein